MLPSFTFWERESYLKHSCWLGLQAFVFVLSFVLLLSHCGSCLHLYLFLGHFVFVQEHVGNTLRDREPPPSLWAHQSPLQNVHVQK